MTRLYSILVLITVVLAGFPAAADQQWPEPIEREHFTYYLDTPHHAPLIDSVLGRTRALLIQLLGDSLSYRPAIHVVSDLGRFEQLIGGHFPDWGAAAAVPTRRLMAIKSPDHFNLNRSLDELLAHEFSHLALAHRCRQGTAPRWFDEGLAMMVSSEWGWSDNLAMSKGVVFGQVIALTDIQRVNHFNESQAHLAYAESYLAVKYLFDDYSINAVNVFLDRIAAGESHDVALLAATGSNHDGFDKEFLASLHNRFNLVSLFMDTIYLWIALAVVLIAGGVRSIRRRRQYYEELDEHDKLHSTDFDYGDPDNPEQPDDDEPWRQ